MVHIDSKSFRAIRAMLVSRRSPFRYRALMLAFLLVGHFPFTLVTAIAQWVDDRVYPRWKEHPHRAPVFIVANPRSGTTFLHRLLALDEERFVPMQMWHTMLPAITAQRGVLFLQKLDRAVGSPAGRVVHWIERQFFGGWDGVHNTGVGRTEEDEAIFFMAMATASQGLVYPDNDLFEPLAIFDDLETERRQAVMAFYEDCLRRFLYANHESRTYLCKNVFSSGRIRSLAEKFPEARFIHIVRHPYEAIPSFCSMFSMPWKFLQPEIQSDSEQVRAWARIGVAFYRHLHQVTRDWPSDRIVDVSYDELMEDPEGAVRRVCGQIGVPITDEFAVRLRAESSTRMNYERKHRYTMEQFGLTPEWIYDQLSDIFEVYGFERDPEVWVNAAE